MSIRQLLTAKWFISAWDSLITLLTLYLAVIIPFNLALRIWPAQLAFEDTLPVTIIFALDIVFNLFFFQRRLGFNFHSSNEKKAYYFRNWFIFDVIALIPFGVFMSSLWQLLRLVKLKRVIRILEEWRARNLKYHTQVNLLFFAIAMLFTMHWMGCGWMVMRGVDESISHTANYINSLYWSVTTITTVGYGDVVPQTIPEKIYTIFAMLIGLGFYGFLIGNIANILAQRDPAQEHYAENMERLSTIVKYRGLSKDLEHKIQEYYNYKLQRHIGNDESDFLDSLPSNLRRKVALFLKKDLLENIPLFQHGNEAFIEAIAVHLKIIVLTPGDYVFRAGDIGEEMYFIIQGELKAVAGDGKTELSRLSDGDFFGEIALFLHKPRTASIRAESYCDLYSLSQSAFEEVIKRYPYFAEKIEEMVKSRGGD